LLFHVRQRGGDAVEHTLDVHVEVRFQSSILRRSSGERRHESGAVDYEGDSRMSLHS
jgi:hypothetical protein